MRVQEVYVTQRQGCDDVTGQRLTDLEQTVVGAVLRPQRFPRVGLNARLALPVVRQGLLDILRERLDGG
jgi:hypothetical protein